MSRQIMVIDYDKCVRYAKGDAYLKTPMVQWRCPLCAYGVDVRGEDPDGKPATVRVAYLKPGSFSAKLAPEGKPPVCTDHPQTVRMERY